LDVDSFPPSCVGALSLPGSPSCMSWGFESAVVTTAAERQAATARHAAGWRRMVDGTKRPCGDDGALPVGRGVPPAMGAATA
jgi:hypothetical protein